MDINIEKIAGSLSSQSNKNTNHAKYKKMYLHLNKIEKEAIMVDKQLSGKLKKIYDLEKKDGLAEELILSELEKQSNLEKKEIVVKITCSSIMGLLKGKRLPVSNHKSMRQVRFLAKLLANNQLTENNCVKLYRLYIIHAREVSEILELIKKANAAKSTQ